VTIRLTVNGKPRSFDGAPGVASVALIDFLAANDINPRLVAVAINGDVIPKHDYAGATISDGDVIEIVRMVGGGAL
jgi:thiamine biosynthesis protein ThiS